MEGVRCTVCGTQAPKGESICKRCGYSIYDTTICPKCHAELPEDITACYMCGCHFDENGAVDTDYTENPDICPKCGSDLSDGADICYKCGCRFDENGCVIDDPDSAPDLTFEELYIIREDLWEQALAKTLAELPESERRGAEKRARAKHTRSKTMRAVRELGRIYGWSGTHKLWKTTRGFISGVETAIRKYCENRKRPIDFDRVKTLVRVIRALPNVKEVPRYIEETCSDMVYGWSVLSHADTCKSGDSKNAELLAMDEVLGTDATNIRIADEDYLLKERAQTLRANEHFEAEVQDILKRKDEA